MSDTTPPPGTGPTRNVPTDLRADETADLHADARAAGGGSGGADGGQPWHVYDRHATLLAVTGTLAGAEAWAIEHWGVVEVADRQQVDTHDYWYLLLAAPPESGFATRDFQARIMRSDRAHEVGRDDGAAPRYPH